MHDYDNHSHRDLNYQTPTGVLTGILAPAEWPLKKNPA